MLHSSMNSLFTVAMATRVKKTKFNPLLLACCRTAVLDSAANLVKSFLSDPSCSMALIGLRYRWQNRDLHHRSAT